MNSFAKVLAVAVAAVGMCSSPLYAAQITGNITLEGDFKPKIGTVSTQNMALATAIDFLPLGGGMGTFVTGSATNDLSAFANLTGGSIKDFSFNPFVPVSGFYSISTGGQTLSFDLSTISIANQNASFLNLTGTGTVHLTGFDDTAGSWNFSGQSSNGASRNATFSWSAGSTAFPQNGPPTNVPEPGALMLLGAGLASISVARRRKH